MQLRHYLSRDVQSGSYVSIANIMSETKALWDFRQPLVKFNLFSKRGKLRSKRSFPFVKGFLNIWMEPHYDNTSIQYTAIFHGC